jgi:hypothetical protein
VGRWSCSWEVHLGSTRLAGARADAPFEVDVALMVGRRVGQMRGLERMVRGPWLVLHLWRAGGAGDGVVVMAHGVGALPIASVLLPTHGCSGVDHGRVWFDFAIGDGDRRKIGVRHCRMGVATASRWALVEPVEALTEVVVVLWASGLWPTAWLRWRTMVGFGAVLPLQAAEEEEWLAEHPCECGFSHLVVVVHRTEWGHGVFVDNGMCHCRGAEDRRM